MDAHTTYEKIGIISKAIAYISGLSIGIGLLISGITLGILSFMSF
jgi:hypothetical protein